MDAIKEMKSEIFDIIVEQDRAQVYYNDLEKVKQTKIAELAELIKQAQTPTIIPDVVTE